MSQPTQTNLLLCCLCTEFRNRGEKPNAQPTFSDLLEFDCEFCDERRKLQRMLPWVDEIWEEETGQGNAQAFPDSGTRNIDTCLPCRDLCFTDEATTRPVSSFLDDCEMSSGRLWYESLDYSLEHTLEIDEVGLERGGEGSEGAAGPRLTTEEILDRSKFFVVGVAFFVLVLALFK